MRASDFDLELDELNRRSVGRLMTAEVFDLSAFNALYSYLREKATLIKQEHVVSKQVLSVLIGVQRVIESRSEHDAMVRENKNLVAKFAMLLDLIAYGEDCGDLRPRTPRVL